MQTEATVPVQDRGSPAIHAVNADSEVNHTDVKVGDGRCESDVDDTVGAGHDDDHEAEEGGCGVGGDVDGKCSVGVDNGDDDSEDDEKSDVQVRDSNRVGDGNAKDDKGGIAAGSVGHGDDDVVDADDDAKVEDVKEEEEENDGGVSDNEDICGDGDGGDGGNDVVVDNDDGTNNDDKNSDVLVCDSDRENDDDVKEDKANVDVHCSNDVDEEDEDLEKDDCGVSGMHVHDDSGGSNGIVNDMSDEEEERNEFIGKEGYHVGVGTDDDNKER
ncbi:hypothetical protein ACOMHN_019027 [Nucella lapillus]